MSQAVSTSARGFGIVEVIVGAAIISFSLVGVIATFGNFLKLGDQSVKAAQAAFLLEETAEVVRLFRDKGWSNVSGLTTGTNYFLNFTGGNWATSTQNVFVDGLFERRFQVTAVNRDGDSDIVVSGTNDPDTRLITATVAWLSGSATTTRAASFYLTNMFDS